MRQGVGWLRRLIAGAPLLAALSGRRGRQRRALHRRRPTMPGSCAGKGFFVQGRLAPSPKKHILHDMLRLLKKWRLVRQLRKECLGHIGRQGDGFVSRQGTMWVSKGAFAQQRIEHLWRARFWSERHKTEK